MLPNRATHHILDQTKMRKTDVKRRASGKFKLMFALLIKG